MYDQRDIVLAPFPYTDLTNAKKRPVLIVSNKTFNNGEDRICCLITSKGPANAIPVNSFSKGKLPFKSWVKPHRIFTINERIIHKKLCTVTPEFHDKIVQTLHAHLR